MAAFQPYPSHYILGYLPLFYAFLALLGHWNFFWSALLWQDSFLCLPQVHSALSEFHCAHELVQWLVFRVHPPVRVSVRMYVPACVSECVGLFHCALHITLFFPCLGYNHQLRFLREIPRWVRSRTPCSHKAQCLGSSCVCARACVRLFM